MTAAPRPHEIFDFLIGKWSFRREIPGQAVMKGMAAFTIAEGDRAAYQEAGCLRLVDGQEFDAKRSYIYQRLASGFAVFFDETPPRLFHEAHLSADEKGHLLASARHLCGSDLYRSEYLFEPNGRFIISHTVSGPRKNYVSHTWYRRATP